MNTLSRDSVRKMDETAIKEFDIPEIILMENAGRSVTEFLLNAHIKAKIIVCCGKGNNGGDGLVIARHLSNHHVPVKVFLFADEKSIQGSSSINYKIVKKSGIEVQCISNENGDFSNFESELKSADCVVDALLGTGLQNEVNAFYTKVISSMNEFSKEMIAVDIPSGLDCDTGKPLGISVRANTTLTIGVLKDGFLNSDSSEWTGKVFLMDAGYPCLLKKDFGIE
ncbi:MAG: NAD(P)H-hydrate epimerase [Gammaproteobacteria bacterium]|nr:NAD(P)H-hydrate epimerase [Gammaproteobacteria bacterium]